MADEILEVVSKPESLEVRDGELLISITTNISIELYPASPVFRARSRAAATSKMVIFAIKVNGFQRISIITKCSTLNVTNEQRRAEA